MWLLIILLPIAAALAARWWFGLRVLAEVGGRACRCDLTSWTPPAEAGTAVQRAEHSAAEFGKQLRIKALAEWRERDPKAAAARGNSLRFGMAVPPLTGIVAIMATIVAKIRPIYAIALFLAATALAAALGILALPAELTAIRQAAKNLRAAKNFPNRTDEDAVIRCALAYAWKETLPPLLALIQR
jgi:hypothetical protein